MIEIRLLKPQDLEIFDLLWSEYMEEAYEAGDTTLPTGLNLRYFHELAKIYSVNPTYGSVMVAFSDHVPVGICMWGKFVPEPEIKTTLGLVANAWGTYVRPSYRGLKISQYLREASAKHLRHLGVESLIGSVNSGNDAAEASARNFGFTPMQKVVVLNLKDPKWQT